MRDALAELTAAWPLLTRLRGHVPAPPGSDRLARVRRASPDRFPEAWAELAAFAEGAAMPLDDLALLNVRGDLGIVAGGIGCSELAWRRERSLIGHNEDGAPENAGRCALLTLALDGLPPITAFWYPGFLPSNAFTVTGDSLVWTIDHLPVASPVTGRPGTSRRAACSDRRGQSTRPSATCRRIPPRAGSPTRSATGRGRIVGVEAAAGRHACVEAAPERPLLWHTNHGRCVPGADPAPGGSTVRRGEMLGALGIPATRPGPGWFPDSRPIPHQEPSS